MTTLTPLETLRDAVAATETLTRGMPDDLDALALVYAVVDRLRRRLGIVEADLSTRMRQSDMGRTLTIVGVGTWERMPGSKTVEWDGTRVASLVATRAAETAYSESGGELVPPAVLAHHIAAELVECAGLDNKSQTWRAGKLRDRNVDPDQYRRTEPATPSLRFIPANTEEGAAL